LYVPLPINTIVRRQAKHAGVNVPQARAQAIPISTTAHDGMPCEARHPCRQQKQLQAWSCGARDALAAPIVDAGGFRNSSSFFRSTSVPSRASDDSLEGGLASLRHLLSDARV